MKRGFPEEKRHASALCATNPVPSSDSAVPTLKPSEYLRALIAQNGGAISVERFMQEALYHPQFGYYANRVRKIGRGGDFSTSATLHPALVRAVAAWAVSHRAEVAVRGSWHVIELGGGSGEMASGFLRALGWRGRWGLQYHLVEISEPLKTLQQAHLQRFKRRVRWHRSIEDALEAAGGRALIFSNEFVDAFPCVQLARSNASENPWSEVMLTWPHGSPHPLEQLAPWSAQPDSPVESAILHTQFTSSALAGQRVEIHRSYRLWLEKWVPHWRAGRLLTIDYGALLERLYFRRPRGTLRGYFHHQTVNAPEIYQRFGQQDLTADVNFTDLQEWGTSLGLQTAEYCTQATFLRRWLCARDLARAEKQPGTPLAYLFDENGPGGAFKVLEQTYASLRSDSR